MDFYMVTKDFAGPASTTVAAIAAAWITYSMQDRSLMLQRKKLDLDLFEKKHDLYTKFQEMVTYIINSHPKTVDHAKIGDFRRQIDEGRFFFSSKTLAYLQRCEDACEAYLIRMSDRPTGLYEDSGKTSAFAEEAARLLADVRGIFGEAPKEFEREMRITLPLA